MAAARPAPNVIAKIVLAKVARSKFEESGKLLFCKMCFNLIFN